MSTLRLSGWAGKPMALRGGGMEGACHGSGWSRCGQPVSPAPLPSRYPQPPSSSVTVLGAAARVRRPMPCAFLRPAALSSAVDGLRVVRFLWRTRRLRPHAARGVGVRQQGLTRRAAAELVPSRIRPTDRGSDSPTKQARERAISKQLTMPW